jgi:hypothetical protein
MLDCGKYPIKRAVGETVTVEAKIYADGHDRVAASLLYKKQAEPVWQTIGMTELGNDRRQGRFAVLETGIYEYTIKAKADDPESPWAIGSPKGGTRVYIQNWAPWRILKNWLKRRKNTIWKSPSTSLISVP